MTRIQSLALPATSILILTSAACGHETTPPPEPPQTTAASPPSTGDGFTLGDSFGVLHAIHAAEVEQGTLAQKRATDPKVKAYAEKVVSDHKARMRKDDKLMSGLGVTPRDSTVSDRIKNLSDQQAARLNDLSGADFDRAYIDQQINYYRTALDVFDTQLLPNARDPQVRANLTEARSKANDHLKEAQDLRLSLINKP
jgi:putative membrane protein